MVRLALSVIVLVSSSALSFAFRKHAHREASIIGVDCPADVSRNTKGDCISAIGARIDEKCCLPFDRCKIAITDALVAYNERLSLYYFGGCDANKNDIKPIGDHSYEVVSGTKFCADTCQAVANLSQRLDIQVSEECGDFSALKEQFSNMLMLRGVVVALDTAFFACGSLTTEEHSTTGMSTTVEAPTTSTSTSQSATQCCCGPNPHNRLPVWIKGRYLYPNRDGRDPDRDGYYPNPSGRYPRCEGWYANKDGRDPDCFGRFRDGEWTDPPYEMPVEAGYDACGNVNLPDAWGRQPWL